MVKPYSKGSFKEILNNLKKDYKNKIVKTSILDEVKRLQGLFMSKERAINNLSKEYARLEKDYKGNIPSGLHEISIINFTLLYVMANKSPERINREVNLAKEKIQLLKK